MEDEIGGKMMMINKRLIGTVAGSKKYIAGNVILQWCSLLANIAMMTGIACLLQGLYDGTADQKRMAGAAVIGDVAVLVRFLCTVGASRMGYLSSKAVKKILREKIFCKLLGLGASYREQVSTAEVVQVAVEGVEQLETYFGAYLPQFFYAMLAPLTLFVYICFVNIPSAIVLFICVPLIPVSMREKIRAVMRFSGPRMMFHHPVMAIRHVLETKKEKKKLEEPTVPFFLATVFCFANSSRKLHDWFVGSRLYKKHLESFVLKKGMTVRTKAAVLIGVTALMGFGFVMMLRKGIYIPCVILTVVWVCHIVYFLFGVKTICAGENVAANPDKIILGNRS